MLEKKENLKEGLAAHLQKLIALDASVDDFWSGFIELLAATPHLLESLQSSKDASTNPD